MAIGRICEQTLQSKVVVGSSRYVFVWAVARTVWVTVSTLYAVCAYLLWCGVFLLPLRFTCSSLYWSMEAVLFRFLQSLVAHWMQTAGYTVSEVGADINACARDECLLLVNHQSTGDVPTLMYFLLGKPAATGRVLWIIDSVFRYTHFGICSMLRGDFFISSGKKRRANQLAQLKSHMEQVYNTRQRKWVILFPEGGFLRKRRATSQLYASKHNYPALEHVTLPRLGAMQTLMDLLSPQHRNGYHLANGCKWRPLKWVIDITIGYPDHKPLDAFNVTFGNRAPCETTLHYRLYPADKVPLEPEKLQTWLFRLYEEKDKLLETFYKTGRFPPTSPSESDGRVISQPRRLQLSEWWLSSIHVFFIVSLVMQCYVVREAVHWLGELLVLGTWLHT